jgi:DNA-binding LacI/PurR family transcriptional regulator
MSKPTLKNIADEVGVSLTTASFALSGKGRVSEKVRIAVEKAAVRLGYERKEKENSERIFAILFNLDPSWAMVFPLIRPIISEIEVSCKKRNEFVVLIPVTMDADDDEMLKKIIVSRCSGVFTIHFARESVLDQLESHGIPVIVIMNGMYQDHYSSVLVDDFQGAYEATSHLLKLGHVRIAYVDTNRLGLNVLSTDRFIGFKKALDEHGVNLPPEWKLFAPVDDVDYLESRIRTIMNCREPPTAFFALDDQVGVRLYAILRNLGFRIPEDMSIIAPGDVMNYEDPSVPRLTTLRINTQIMGHLAAEMMIERLKYPMSERHVIKIKQQLIQRGSTKALRFKDKSSGNLLETSRGRVMAAFSRETIKTIPKWLGIGKELLEKIERELGLNEEQFRQRIKDDVRVIGVGYSYSSSLERDTSPFGISRIGYSYGQAQRHPLGDSPTLEALRSFPWPDPLDVDVTTLRQKIKEYDGQFAIFGGDPSPFWHDAIDLVGFETLLMLMYDEPDFVYTLLNRIVDYHIAVSVRIFEEAGELYDVFLIRNDFGSQTGPLIGPDLFGRFIVPCLRRITDVGHRYGLKVMLHSGGSIRPLIPMIIEAGVDALHPLQPDCPGMRPATIARDFGSSLVLSGAIDARGALLKGRPDDVPREARSVLNELAPGSNYIASPSIDALTDDIPLENILALFDEISSYRRF